MVNCSCWSLSFQHGLYDSEELFPNSVSFLLNVSSLLLDCKPVCWKYLRKIPRLWTNANGPLTSLALDTCDAGTGTGSEGHYYAGGRQTENLHRYPMKDNRAFSFLDGIIFIFQTQTDIDKPYLRLRWGCIMTYLSRFPICSCLINCTVDQLICTWN